MRWNRYSRAPCVVSVKFETSGIQTFDAIGIAGIHQNDDCFEIICAKDIAEQCDGDSYVLETTIFCIASE